MSRLEDLQRRAEALPGAKGRNPLEDFAGGLTEPQYQAWMDDIEADVIPGVTWLGDRALVSTGGTQQTPVEPKRNEPKPLTAEERANAVNYGSGKLKATQTNLGAAVGLTADQASQILQASRNLAGDTDALSRKFHEADAASRSYEGKNVTYGPMTPEASRIAQQLADAEKMDKLGAQIRGAMVDGDKSRLKSLLRQAGLPYGDWL